MILLDRPRKHVGVEIDGVDSSFLDAPDGIKVGTHSFHTMFNPYENSWGTMVTLRTPRNSAAKETSLLTSSHFLWRTSGSTNYLFKVRRSRIGRTSTVGSIYTIH